MFIVQFIFPRAKHIDALLRVEIKRFGYASASPYTLSMAPLLL